MVEKSVSYSEAKTAHCPFNIRRHGSITQEPALYPALCLYDLKHMKILMSLISFRTCVLSFDDNIVLRYYLFHDNFFL